MVYRKHTQQIIQKMKQKEGKESQQKEKQTFVSFLILFVINAFLGRIYGNEEAQMIPTSTRSNCSNKQYFLRCFILCERLYRFFYSLFIK